MCLPMVNIGLKMVLWKPKHVAKKLMYCSCVDTEWTILLDIYLKGKGKVHPRTVHEVPKGE